MSFLFDTPEGGDVALVEAEDLAAVSFDNVPYIPRRWLQPDYLPVGTVSVWAAKGETGKGMLFCASAARTVLGLPFPNEDQAVRREPGCVMWISGPGEDDSYEDLAPRLRAAIARAVAEFGLDPALAEESGAIQLVYDMSVWRDDSPVTLPADCSRVLAEIGKINKKNAEDGKPPVTLVVADSLQALLSQGYTIDSRQGAVRTMVALNLFARRADVAFPVLHHLTKDGKVAGSPAVLNAVRLAFIIERSKDDERIRTIVRHKSNIAASEPLCYVITGYGPAVHAEFVSGEDARAQRVSAATEQGAAPDPASRASRLATAGCRHPSRIGTAAQCSGCPLKAGTETGPFRVLRQTRAVDGPAENSRVGNTYATRSEARSAAVKDAGTVLNWTRADGSLNEAAALKRADGALRGYVIVPVPKRAERSEVPA